MKIVVFSTKPYEKEYLNRSLNGHEVKYIDESLSEKSGVLAKGYDAVCIFTNDTCNAAVLSVLKGVGVNYVAIRAAGFDNVDLACARQLGIKVANVPSYSPYSIAEHTVAMILALNRKLIQSYNNITQYDFRLDQLIGFDLHGKTVAVIGLGKIGGIVARIMNGFRCRVIGVDIQEDEELKNKYHVQYMNLDEACKEADIITLHLPFNASTKFIINKERIEKMKKGVMIINTGRGALINTNDLIEKLKDGHVGYAGLDVYEKEKGLFFNDHRNDILQDDTFARLLAFKNVLITGHQAFLTETALTNIADTVNDNLTCWEQGKAAENELA